MTLGGYITLLASLAGLGAAAASQDPTFESPTFTPIFGQDGKEAAAPIVAQSRNTTQKRVSVHFDNAPVSAVVEWLTKQGVNFLVDHSEIPGDRTVSLNVTDQPLER